MGSVWAAPIAYNSPSGVHVLFSTTNATAFCPRTPYPRVGRLDLDHSGLTADGEGRVVQLSAARLSPIVTTTDGKHDAIAWLLNGSLYALSADAGGTLLYPATRQRVPRRPIDERRSPSRGASSWAATDTSALSRRTDRNAVVSLG